MHVLRHVCVRPPLFLLKRHPIHVSWSALHLLFSHPGQCLSAVGGKHGRAAGHRGGHDPLHDQSELLPPRQSARVAGLEESSLRWRSHHGLLLFLPPCMCILLTVVCLLHFVPNIPLEQQSIKGLLCPKPPNNFTSGPSG